MDALDESQAACVLSPIVPRQLKFDEKKAAAAAAAAEEKRKIAAEKSKQPVAHASSKKRPAQVFYISMCMCV